MTKARTRLALDRAARQRTTYRPPPDFTQPPIPDPPTDSRLDTASAAETMATFQSNRDLPPDRRKR